MNRVRVGYKNWRGRSALRVIIPKRIFFGTTEFHPEAQWMLEAWDVDKDVARTFAMKDIYRWDPLPEEVPAPTDS